MKTKNSPEGVRLIQVDCIKVRPSELVRAVWLQLVRSYYSSQ